MILCRVLHIVATCTSLGGLFYARVVLWPSLSKLPEPDRATFLSTMIRRFAYIKWAGVIVVAVTGVIQWIAIWATVVDRGLYVSFFALKMVGAAGLFTITFLLALPAERLRGLQKHRGFWSALNLLCALTIIVGAALMRTVDKV